MRNGDLAAVSCTGSAACITVGGYENRFGTGLALAERWNGTRWAAQPTPALARGIWSGLSGVWCASAAACTAVGWYVTAAGRERALAARWDGRGWAIQPALVPAGSVDSGLFAISCSAPRACTAVGAYFSQAGRELPLAERWNGRGWAIQPAPAPAGSRGSEFSAVSCASPGSCTAVGSFVTRAGQGVTLAERWNGTNWRIQVTPSPAGSLGAGLNAVSCSARRACTAVGDYAPSLAPPGVTVVLAETWNGTRWRIRHVPSPAPPPGVHSGSVLLAVSCGSPGGCTAVGSYTGKAATTATLAERWNGTRWRIQPTPNPAHSIGTGLSAVSCVPGGGCHAVGSYDVQLPLDAVAGVPIPARTLAEAWHGTRWHVQPTRDQGGAATYSELNAVSCTSPRACTAAGDYVTSTGLFAPLAERWNGARWVLRPVPNPAAGAENFLDGVSCASARACTAVGFSAGNSVTALAERWNGTRWRIQPTPRPAHAAGARLSGISCATARACIAVGDRLKGPLPLAEEWNGTRWRILPIPAPTQASQTGLSAVSCTSPRACTAVGSYTTTSGQPFSLAETWDGSRWRLQATAHPASTALSGVSCTGPRACTAVGLHTGSNGVEQALAERWNGRRWATQPTPRAPSAGSWLNAVSCATARSCTAAGAYHTANGATVLLAEDWNGAQWRRAPAANPAPAFDSTLAGISCSAPRTCTAAGSYLALTNVTVTLALATPG